MVAILDAILNLTPSARDPDCPPKFFSLHRGALPGSRVKMIAPRTPSAPGQRRAVSSIKGSGKKARGTSFPQWGPSRESRRRRGAMPGPPLALREAPEKGDASLQNFLS